MREYTFVPGVVAAKTATALPSDAPVFAVVTSAVVQTGAAGGVASTTSPLQATVVPASTTVSGLTAAQFLVNASNEWALGAATTAGTAITIIGYAAGELPQVA